MIRYHFPMIGLLAFLGCGGAPTVSAPATAAAELIDVTVECSWIKATHQLSLASGTSSTHFSQSFGSDTGSDLSPSVSVAHVGHISLKNAFVADDTQSGNIIAVRVSIFDQSSKSTVLSESTYTLYEDAEIVLYENEEYGLIVTATPQAQDQR